jgi:hypothetical protein
MINGYDKTCPTVIGNYEIMTGRVLDRDTASILIFIIPVAAGIVLLSNPWTWILVFTSIALSIAWKIWRNHQWEQWCQQVNPYFNQLIKENQGCLTVVDLSLKANLTGRAARNFLARKAEEYGAQSQELSGKGTVYYFLTASALGSIFDDSEPLEVENPALEATKLPKFAPPAEKPTAASVSNIAKLLELEDTEEATADTEAEVIETPVTPDITVGEEAEVIETPATEARETQAMIQSDLAKRLDTNPSTLARRKSEPDFAEWSRSKDPDGIAWKYLPQTKMFVPENSGS